MTENEQDLQAVMESTGCDRWIARKALTSSDGNVHNAIDLVKKRMSYRTSTCRCGELIAGKWSYCPYCGTKKEGSYYDQTVSAVEAEWQVTTPELPAADQSEVAEKRAIVQRLKDYRSANGWGCLDKVSEKTAHRKEARISSDTLRDIAGDRAPKMKLSEWRKIAKALDLLETVPC